MSRGAEPARRARLQRACSAKIEPRPTARAIRKIQRGCKAVPVEVVLPGTRVARVFGRRRFCLVGADLRFHDWVPPGFRLVYELVYFKEP
jgi:hypothetical protein